MNEEFFNSQDEQIRAMAGRADPFAQKCLLALAHIYDERQGAGKRLGSLKLPVDRPESTTST